MAIREDIENGHDGAPEDGREPLMPKNLSDEEGYVSQHSSNNTGTAWMVYLSTFVAVAVGAMVGAITSGPFSDYIGRKGAMRFSSSFCVAGWLAICFAKGPWALDIGRLATGYGMGALSYVVPVFIAEIAPQNLRGTLTTVTQLMAASGVSVAFIIGTVLPWRVLALTGKAMKGREKEFETTLQKLRGRAADISYEASEIKDYIESLEKLPKARLLDIFQRRNLHSVLVVVVAFSTTIVDKVGRKPLLLVKNGSRLS
ncbi:unnamed protein product [Dovyalis caffra]|uniref:Major facilitator superfamily (MFS) profile domain-containing protein n=1 Tax=Dovyalis caffra TaxID=77055 RepID=A0AAV1SCN9_9ROSI|nr:unnamed protein product [Dovyalis caffra]